MPFSKYSPKQKKIARVAPPRNKITGADFKVLRSRNAQKNTNSRKKAWEGFQGSRGSSEVA